MTLCCMVCSDLNICISVWTANIEILAHLSKHFEPKNRPREACFHYIEIYLLLLSLTGYEFLLEGFESPAVLDAESLPGLRSEVESHVGIEIDG